MSADTRFHVAATRGTNVSVSPHPRQARLSRLDPANWPTGAGLLLFVAWLAYAIAMNVWVYPLIWTVLPSGLTLYLFAERYPWRVILLFVVPLAVLTGISQVVATWSDVPTSVAFAIYLLACAYFSVVVCVPNRDRLIGGLPRRFLGERFDGRLAWTRFEESLVTANPLVRQVGESDGKAGRGSALNALAAVARRESRRGGTWQDAWTAHATWLDALDELVGIEPSTDEVRHVHDLLVGLDEAHMAAIERMSVLDPAP